MFESQMLVELLVAYKSAKPCPNYVTVLVHALHKGITFTP